MGAQRDDQATDKNHEGLNRYVLARPGAEGRADRTTNRQSQHDPPIECAKAQHEGHRSRQGDEKLDGVGAADGHSNGVAPRDQVRSDYRAPSSTPYGVEKATQQPQRGKMACHGLRWKLPECFNDDHETHDHQVGGDYRSEYLAWKTGQQPRAKRCTQHAGQHQGSEQVRIDIAEGVM